MPFGTTRARSRATTTRSAELDLRAAKVASAEQEVELREARLTEQLQTFREERERLSELETRLTATEAFTGERNEQVEGKLRELRDADRQRENLASSSPNRPRR